MKVHVGELGDVVGAVLALGDANRIQISRRVATKSMEGVQVQVIIPGACDAQRRIRSGTSS